MNDTGTEKKLLVFPIGVEPTTFQLVLWMFYHGVIGNSWQTLGYLTRSMVTNLLHTARIGMLICDAHAQ